MYLPPSDTNGCKEASFSNEGVYHWPAESISRDDGYSMNAKRAPSIFEIRVIGPLAIAVFVDQAGQLSLTRHGSKLNLIFRTLV